MKARQLPSGNFNVVVSYYDDFDKRKQKSFTAATEAKALKKAQDYLDGINTVYDDTTTLEKAMKYYIENKMGIIQPTTIRTYKILAENAFTCLHQTKLCDLRPVEIQRAISIESKRASPKYVKNAYGLLKSVLKMFEVDVNLSSVKLPRVVKKEKELPDFATMFDIFHGDEIELFVLLAAWLSLRIGEIAGLQFRDVDEKQKLLHIRRTVIPTEDGNKLREGGLCLRRKICIGPEILFQFFANHLCMAHRAHFLEMSRTITYTIWVIRVFSRFQFFIQVTSNVIGNILVRRIVHVVRFHVQVYKGDLVVISHRLHHTTSVIVVATR